MPNKEELEREINEKLGTDLEFSRMTKEDLEDFNTAVQSGLLMENMAREYLKEHGESVVDSAIDSWEPGTIARRIL